MFKRCYVAVGRVERSGKMSRKVESCRVTSSQVVHVDLKLFPEYAAITQVHEYCPPDTTSIQSNLYEELLLPAISSIVRLCEERAIPALKRKRGRMCIWVVVSVVLPMGMYGFVEPKPGTIQNYLNVFLETNTAKLT